MKTFLEVSEEVASALGDGRAVVALESTVISHGLPYPINLQTAAAMEAAVREKGAIPATIGLLDGRIMVGLSAAQIERLAEEKNVAKVSRADFGPVLAARQSGATTVAATMMVSAAAGIRLFATGGIGGCAQRRTEHFRYLGRFVGVEQITRGGRVRGTQGSAGYWPDVRGSRDAGRAGGWIWKQGIAGVLFTRERVQAGLLLRECQRDAANVARALEFGIAGRRIDH